MVSEALPRKTGIKHFYEEHGLKLLIWHESKDYMSKNKFILAGEVLHRWDEKESGAKKKQIMLRKCKKKLN